MDFSSIIEAVGDVKVLNSVFNNYMSDDERTEFVNHYANMYDIEHDDDVLYEIDPTSILDELQQYLNVDQMEDLTDWLMHEYQM